MNSLEIVLTTFINAIPIIVLFIPYLLIRKKAIANLYLRIYAGILVFYLMYWILPIIFQVGESPKELESTNNAAGLGYLFAHLGSLISLFAYYPLVTLPFIFFLTPFISLIYVWNRLRKEEGPIAFNLKLLTYNFTESPYKRIRDALIRNNWKREKEILKLMIVLLPISLYLLQVILTVSGLESDPLNTGETALGWFIEILFVYLAIFIFSIELLFSSQVALKGRYVGEEIRTQTYKSLYTVGAPISILSIILFVAQYLDSIFVTLYFFGYFIMASIIFVLFLKIFEPISLLIFIKIIDWWKNKKIKRKTINFTNFYYGIIFSFLAVFFFLFLNMVALGPLYVMLFGNETQVQELIDTGKFLPPISPTLENALSFDVMIIFNFLSVQVFPLIITVVLLYYTLKYLKSTFLGFFSYLPVILAFSILFAVLEVPSMFNFAPEEYWITGQTSVLPFFGFDFYTFRTAALDANLSGLLGVLAIPYLYSRYIFTALFWGIFILYIRKDFSSKNIPIEENLIESTVFATVGDYLSYDDYIQGKIQYLITKKPDILLEKIEQEREEVKDILNALSKDTLLENIKPEDENEKKRFYFTLKYLYFNELIDIWKSEFKFTFERVEKQGLYIIYDDGRGIFNYPFNKDFAQDPGLVSGMFAAITSFIKEMTRSTQVLKKIDHGDITILLEYGKRIFGALFIKGTQSPEVRAKLKAFVDTFEQKYSDVLHDWTGALIYFKDDDKVVEEIFREE
ncbi:MAG: hypothetical protein ACFFA6_02015 [Promethearchaeota archaeon]